MKSAKCPYPDTESNQAIRDAWFQCARTIKSAMGEWEWRKEIQGHRGYAICIPEHAWDNIWDAAAEQGA
ncbi:MAG: hypothetical protein Q7O66_14915 [Dehalococcoidia bacterium]|nr:hypothetical protein [Dehalococcoidia bacterium]